VRSKMWPASQARPQRELQEVVHLFERNDGAEFLSGHRDKDPKGVLLVMAAQVTGQNAAGQGDCWRGGVPFFSIGGLRVRRVFVGGAPARVRDLF